MSARAEIRIERSIVPPSASPPADDKLADVLAVAEEAGLRYVNGDEPGFARRRCGRGFVYLHPGGEPLRDRTVRTRLQALAVPPAWSGVWYCKDPRGHIQATGRDERGRKQYLYHPDWREVRDRSKFGQLGDFARALAALRRQVKEDLRANAPEEAAVLAAAAQLLDLTGIRVGNTSYFEQNGTVGLTTLQSRHTEIKGERLALRFKAKSGRQTKITVSDRRLTRILLRCEELPGQRLFRYRSAAGVKEIDSTRFNDYLRAASKADISAKAFRTWIGTVAVVEAWLASADGPLKIKDACAVAARRLANTPAITRKSYIHPDVLAIATTRVPSDAERRVGRRDGAQLSGPERVCANLLRGPAPGDSRA